MEKKISHELKESIGYHVRKGLISDEFAEELLADPKKAEEWLNK